MTQLKIFEERIRTDNPLLNLFDKPSIIALIGDINEGKSNLLYYLIQELRKTKDFKLYTYGLRSYIEQEHKIFSLHELEKIKNSFIIVDETFTLFDLDNRKVKKQIEASLRLINHNNNILLLCMIPENVKKFISGKINNIIYKRCTFEDFINGTSIKNNILNYKGIENGSTILDLNKDEALIFDGHYHKVQIPYVEINDTKRNNVPILVPKNVPEKVQ